MDLISLSVCESSQGELNHNIYSDALSAFDLQLPTKCET